MTRQLAKERERYFMNKKRRSFCRTLKKKLLTIYESKVKTLDNTSLNSFYATTIAQYQQHVMRVGKKVFHKNRVRSMIFRFVKQLQGLQTT